MVERGVNKVKGAGKGKVWRDGEGRAGDWGLCQEESEAQPRADPGSQRVTSRAPTDDLTVSLSGPQTSYL